MPGSIPVSRFLPSYGALMFFVRLDRVEAARGVREKVADWRSGLADASLWGIIYPNISTRRCRKERIMLS